MKREEFCCIIGYQGDKALADKSAMKLVKGTSSRELADSGLYKAAMASALFEENIEDQDYILSTYRQRCSTSVETRDQLIRMLGIYPAYKEGIQIKAL